MSWLSSKSRLVRTQPIFNEAAISMNNEGAQLAKASSSSVDGQLGLKAICQPKDAAVNVIFVHGLTGNRLRTWTHEKGEFWPKILASNIPNAAIMTYGYNADVVKFLGGVSSNTLRDNGKALAQAILNTSEGSETRPIIFIAHSLGGLVVQQALLVCRDSNEEALQRIPRTVAGIIFMGTPHNGTDTAFWGELAARFTKILKSTNNKIVGILKPDSQMLGSVTEIFQQRLIEDWKDMKIFCFYEAHKMSGIGQIVPKESAILKQYDSAPIEADHRQMVRFSGPNDLGFVLVSSLVKRWIEQISSNESSAARKGQEKDQVARVVYNQYIGSINSSGGKIFHGNTFNGGQAFN